MSPTLLSLPVIDTNSLSLSIEERFQKFLVSNATLSSFELVLTFALVSPISMFAVNSMTLHAKSEATMEKTYLDTISTVDGTKLEVTAIEHIPEERAIHYIASGNYKL